MFLKYLGSASRVKTSSWMGPWCNVFNPYYILPSHVDICSCKLNKWNESGFRPPLCTYRLNWARRTSWGWWDDWDDTVLQTQNSKFEPWRSEAEHATSRSRRLPTILTFTRGWGRNIFVSFKPPSPGTEPRTLAWKAAVLTTTLGPPPSCKLREQRFFFNMKYAFSTQGVPLAKYRRFVQRCSLNLQTVFLFSHTLYLDGYVLGTMDMQFIYSFVHHSFIN